MSLLGLMAGIWEIAVLPFLPSKFAIQPLLPAAVLLLVSSARSRVMGYMIAGALVIDAYRWAYFDIAVIRLTLLMLMLDLIAHRFLTNRSVYASVALILIGRGLDWISSFLLGLIGRAMNTTQYTWLMPANAGYIILWDVLLVSLGFIALANLTRRFVTLARGVNDF